MGAQPLAPQLALNVDGFTPCSPDSANELLVRWGHYLGPCDRPFGVEPWVFLVDNKPMAVAGGSPGGGTWTNKRADDHPATGHKTLWRWRYR